MTDQPLPSIHANDVQGFCPACRHGVLMLGEGGHVTCTLIDCPNPSAADELLHGERVTASTPLVCSDERHAAKVADLEQQLARLREGEEPGYDPLIVPTPGQWIQQFNQATAEKRLEVVGRLIDAAERVWACTMNQHEERIHNGRHAEMALNEVRQTVTDMENTTGARTWAGWLRDAMKRGPKHCLLCATEAKPEPDTTGQAEADPDERRTQYAALAFNAVLPALKAHDRWLPLSVRRAVADAVLAVRDEQLEELADRHRRLGIELEHWQTVITQELRTERDQLAAALREVLSVFRHVNDNATRTTVGYVSAPVQPADYDRWRAVLNPPKEQQP